MRRIPRKSAGPPAGHGGRPPGPGWPKAGGLTSQPSSLQAEIRKDFRVRFVLREDRVARVAVLRDHAAVARLVLAVVAPKTTEKILMAQVVRVRSPPHLHRREDVSEIDLPGLVRGCLDLGAMGTVDVRILRPIEVDEPFADLRRCRVAV